MFTMEDDKACINIFDLVHEYLPDERKQELAESLSCADFVIDCVANQILTGYTESYGFGGSWSTSIEPSTPLEKAQRKVAKGANDAARLEIERLERKLQFVEKTKNEYMNKYFDVYHSGYWPMVPE